MPVTVTSGFYSSVNDHASEKRDKFQMAIFQRARRYARPAMKTVLSEYIMRVPIDHQSFSIEVHGNAPYQMQRSNVMGLPKRNMPGRMHESDFSNSLD